MDIIKFLNQTWNEIQDQDNPAMQRRNGTRGPRNRECIMVFKGRNPRITNGGYVVAYNPPEGDIISKGLFWTAENAELFADALDIHLMEAAKNEG